MVHKSGSLKSRSHDLYYFNFANVSFDNSNEATSASNVFLCACVISAFSRIRKTKYRAETYPVLIHKSHVLRDGLYVVCLGFYFSDFIQVQLRELELLLTLGDLGVKVDQALRFSMYQKE